MRKIPATMATQHPDNAQAAYWCGKKFISTGDEIEEAFLSFDELKCEEYMWDWEGKFVDEAVIDKLFRQHHAFFKKHPLGKDYFLTYRIPNIWKERGFRLARAFMNILTAEDLAQEVKLHRPPIFEVILPMTKSADQLLHIQKTFSEISKLKHKIFSESKNTLKQIEIIPLFEEVGDLIDSDKVLEEYLALYKKEFGKKPAYLRPFIARSDPALNAGLIPAVLASKVAISRFYTLEKKYGIPMFPIIGTGSLPFRGGVNPWNIAETIQEYQGIRTMTIQSAFRYDYPKEDVVKALKLIREKLPVLKPKILSDKEIADVRTICAIFEKEYKRSIEKLAPLVNKMAAHIPPRRERMQHIGLFGYARGEGKVTLPRAITFTAVFYSLGVPPEFIGTGRALKEIKKKGLDGLLKKLYLNLHSDLSHAGKYLNKENLGLLAQDIPAFRDLIEDVEETEAFLGINLGPFKWHHFIHRNLTSSIYYKHLMGEDFGAEIEEAARLRRSLG